VPFAWMPIADAGARKPRGAQAEGTRCRGQVVGHAHDARFATGAFNAGDHALQEIRERNAAVRPEEFYAERCETPITTSRGDVPTLAAPIARKEISGALAARILPPARARSHGSSTSRIMMDLLGGRASDSR